MYCSDPFKNIERNNVYCCRPYFERIENLRDRIFLKNIVYVYFLSSLVQPCYAFILHVKNCLQQGISDSWHRKIREKDKTGVYYIHFFILQKRLEAIAHLFFCQNAKRKLNVMAGSLINNNESFGIICNVTLYTITVKYLKFK